MNIDQEWTPLTNEMGQAGPKYIMVFCDGTGKDGESLPDSKKGQSNDYSYYLIVLTLTTFIIRISDECTFTV
jgi:hypothetical protein